MKTLMTKRVVCFVVGQFKILENKINTTEVSENKQRLMGNLKNTFFMARQSQWIEASSLVSFRDHTQAHRTRQDSPRRVISPTQ